MSELDLLKVACKISEYCRNTSCSVLAVPPQGIVSFLEQFVSELGYCESCQGTGDGYCDKDGWHDCGQCNGTGLKRPWRKLVQMEKEIHGHHISMREMRKEIVSLQQMLNEKQKPQHPKPEEKL